MKDFPCIWCLHATPGGYMCTGFCEMTDEERRAESEKYNPHFNRDDEPWAYRGLCPACKKGDFYSEDNTTRRPYGDHTRTCLHCNHVATIREWVDAEDAEARQDVAP